MLGGGLFSNKAVAAPTNPNKDFEVTQPPDDTVSALAFSPAALQQNFLIAGSWDNTVSTNFRSGKSIVKLIYGYSLIISGTVLGG